MVSAILILVAFLTFNHHY